MSKVPCKNCIIFAMCNGLIKDDVTMLAHDKDCSLLLDYLKGADGDNMRYNSMVVNKARKVFGLREI